MYLVPEHIIAQHHPGFIKDQQCGLAVQRLFNPVEEIEQHWHKVFRAKPHQLLDFKYHERGQAQVVTFRIQESAHGTTGGVVRKGIPDGHVGNDMRKMRQRAHVFRLRGQKQGRLVESLANLHSDSDSLQSDKSCQPLFAPGHLGRAFPYSLQWGKGKGISLSDIIVIAPSGKAERQHGTSLVKDKDSGSLVAPKVPDNLGKKRGLAGACWPKNQGMAQIAHMQIEAERCCPVLGSEDSQRRRIFRIEGARAACPASPHCLQWQQIRQVQGVD